MRKYGGGRRKHGPNRKHGGGKKRNAQVAAGATSVVTPGSAAAPAAQAKMPAQVKAAAHAKTAMHAKNDPRLAASAAASTSAASALLDGRIWLAAGLGFIVLQALALHLMGHVAICKCGFVKLWHGVVQSSENSQHLTDWYTFSHVLHGLLFYALFWWLMPRASWIARLAAAIALEAGWEIVENTDFVINRYRTATVSLDYYGDSIVNSVMDNVAMIAGFLLARVLPVAASALLFVGLELFMLWAIRDNLTLNVLMLLWPVEGIAKWQAGG